MIRWRRGTVTGIRREWPGTMELAVDIPGDGIVTLNGLTITFGAGTYGTDNVYTIPLYEAPEVVVSFSGEAC